MNESSEIILEKLNKALEADSDFPTRAQVITALKRATSDINIPLDVIVELLLCEPSLSSRLLHLTNSVYFGRAVQITTLSQAVNQLGLKGVYNLCANFVLLQKFSGLAAKNTAFSDCFLMSLLTSNIASFLDSKNNSDKDEEGYLAGSLFTIGPLLLGFYFPKLFIEAQKRAERKKVGMFKAIEELLGVPAVGISNQIVQSLSVPDIYRDILNEALSLYCSDLNQDLIKKTNKSSTSVCMASILSELIITGETAKDIENGIISIAEKLQIEYADLNSYITKLPNIIGHQNSLLDNSFCTFPDAFVKYLKGEIIEDSETQREDDNLSPYLSQIETAIQESETLPSIIATVMEALTFACEFERVIYLESDFDKTKLLGKLSLGDNIPNVMNISHSLENKNEQEMTIDVKSFHSGMIETFGKPILNNAWPFVAIPVGYEERSLGVIYADKTDNNQETNSNDNSLALTILSDLLDQAVIKNRV